MPSDSDIVVDTHTHLLPGRLAERVREHFGPSARLLVYPLDHGVVRETLASEGVDEIWNLPYAHKPGVAAGLNESSQQIANQAGPLNVVGGMTVHPADQDPAGIVRHAIEGFGLRVLKLHCSVGAFDADDRRLDSVWRLVAETRTPVVVHAGHAANGTTGADELLPLATVAERFPDATIVIAHCGYPAVDAALDLLERHEHLYADLTPVVSMRPQPSPTRMVALSERLLFGSDTPNVAVHVAEHLAALRSLPLSPSQIALITGGNARRLLAE